MAIVRKTQRRGQSTTEVSSGKLRIEDDNNRMIMFDGQDNRLVIGEMPDGSIGFLITKEGFDITEVFI